MQLLLSSLPDKQQEDIVGLIGNWMDSLHHEWCFASSADKLCCCIKLAEALLLTRDGQDPEGVLEDEAASLRIMVKAKQIFGRFQASLHGEQL